MTDDAHMRLRQLYDAILERLDEEGKAEGQLSAAGEGQPPTVLSVVYQVEARGDRVRFRADLETGTASIMLTPRAVPTQLSGFDLSDGFHYGGEAFTLEGLAGRVVEKILREVQDFH